MPSIDRLRVQSSFHRGAGEYDQHTPVQQRVMLHLLQQLELYPVDQEVSMLDIGCGTGRLLELLGQCYPDVCLTGLDLAHNMVHQAAERLGKGVQLIQGDAEQLPFSPCSFSTVLSSSTFQWLDDLSGCFAEVKRVLKPEGRFVFSLFGEGTLVELRESWQQAWMTCGRENAGPHNGTHHFHTCEQVQCALEKAGFRDIEITSGCEVEWYPDVSHLLHAIKRIGAGTARPPSGGGLGWRRLLHEMATVYTKYYGTERGVPTSYHAIYAAGRH